MKEIKNVVVVGGGTAGWITAGRIAAEHLSESRSANIKVTLVESPNIPIIGVGEGTWPTMRSTLKTLGVSETDFIRECDGTFKQGAKFAKWRCDDEDDFYYHPLMIPQGFPNRDLSLDWLLREDLGSFSDSVCFQEYLCEQNLAPKQICTPEFACIANYSYHLDAGKFSVFLKEHCTNRLSVEYIQADITDIINNEFGDIATLNGVANNEHISIDGDLFIDCTGSHALLIGQHFKIPFIDCSDVLEIDRAIATHVAYSGENAVIPTHTISTGQSSGWIWDIGLQSRRGVGYVYCSKYQSSDSALLELKNYIGSDHVIQQPREIEIRSGYRNTFWHRNCVAVGMSAGFLEPLEASSIVLVELAAQMLAEQLPRDKSCLAPMARRFNSTFSYRWQRIIDFLKLHYVLTNRTEPFWRSMSAIERVPQSLKDLMKLWRHRSPSDDDFDSQHEVFPAASYQYVLYGMGYKSDARTHQKPNYPKSVADTEYRRNISIKRNAKSSLPGHRELIQKIHEHGFQAL